MKKIFALSLVAAASLGLAACSETATTETTNESVNDMEAVVDEAANDMDAAADAAMNEMDAAADDAMADMNAMADDADAMADDTMNAM